jgi:hypothetical protein
MVINNLVETDIICYNHAHMLWLLQQGYILSIRSTPQEVMNSDFAYGNTCYQGIHCSPLNVYLLYSDQCYGSQRSYNYYINKVYVYKGDIIP